MTRQLRIAALWLAGVSLAATTAYLGVSSALRGEREPSQAREQLEGARKVARIATELRVLLHNIAGPRPGAAPRLSGAMLAELRAKVRQTQYEILRARLDGPAYDALLLAADRLSACAASPQTESLRSAAHRAQDELESLARDEIDRLERAVKRDRAD